MSTIVDFERYKKNRPSGVKQVFMTCEDCINELQIMKINATRPQQNAINFAISLIVDFIRQQDDGK